MLLKLVRHAPALDGGCVAGRRDVEADCSDGQAFARMRGLIGDSRQVITSPARRCRQTVAALELSPAKTQDALWEQDHGIWEGRPYAELPDLGRLSPAELAAYRPEGGESFEDMAARVTPHLRALQDEALIVAHAGTVRAALSMVVGPAALSFAVAPLSLTVLRRAGDDWAVEAVNLR